LRSCSMAHHNIRIAQIVRHIYTHNTNVATKPTSDVTQSSFLDLLSPM
jgi:hypothetical protein